MGVYRGVIWGVYRGYIGIYIGVMEKKMETTFSILGIDRGNGKENGNYSSILVMNRDYGKENGDY